MNIDRINEIIKGATDLRSIYDKLTEDELNGMSFEDFEKLVAEVPEADSDEELSDDQMEKVAGGIAGIDDFIAWLAKLGRKEIKKQSNEISKEIDKTTPRLG